MRVRGDIFHWIPYKFTPNWAVKITRSDGTVDTIGDNLLDFKCTRMIATMGVGEFELLIENNAGTYSGLYTGGEDVKIYADMDDASTLIFYGTAEKVADEFGDGGQTLKIKGTHVSGELLDITVTKSYSDENCDDVLKDLIDNYATGYTYTNVAASTTSITIAWEHKPFWECFAELCTLTDFDGYVDNTKDFHFFVKDSITNSNEAITFDDKFLPPLEGFGPDTLEIKNRIIVYGSDENGLPIVATAEDSTSQTSYNVKEIILNDSNVKTVTQAQERADAELALLKDTETTGKVRNLWLLRSGINPGEQIWISIPTHQIHAKYTIAKFTHSLLDLVTTIEVKRESKGLPQLFKDRLQQENRLQVFLNPNELRFSKNFEFSDDTLTDSHSNTAVSGGYLVLSGTATNGTWTSVAATATADITKVEVRIADYQDVGSNTYEISVDNGVTWESVTLGTALTVAGTGKKVKVRVNMVKDTNNLEPKIGSLVILYKS